MSPLKKGITFTASKRPKTINARKIKRQNAELTLRHPFERENRSLRDAEEFLPFVLGSVSQPTERSLNAALLKSSRAAEACRKNTHVLLNSLWCSSPC